MRHLQQSAATSCVLLLDDATAVIGTHDGTLALHTLGPDGEWLVAATVTAAGVEAVVDGVLLLDFGLEKDKVEFSVPVLVSRSPIAEPILGFNVIEDFVVIPQMITLVSGTVLSAVVHSMLRHWCR